MSGMGSNKMGMMGIVPPCPNTLSKLPFDMIVCYGLKLSGGLDVNNLVSVCVGIVILCPKGGVWIDLVSKRSFCDKTCCLPSVDK